MLWSGEHRRNMFTCTLPLQQEVELALPILANGKASGSTGRRAELLRHAAEYIIMDNGSRQKVWILKPLLSRLLNHCFRSVFLPPCMVSALVTPIHKKGCTLDTVNYWPTAVGEPLYRLYTIILNKRLVDWSEEHKLRSPTQAGFRPRQSPIHHLFARRPSLTQLASLSAPSMPDSWTCRRLMTRSRMTCCGATWSPLGLAPVCWQPFSLCTPVRFL